MLSINNLSFYFADRPIYFEASLHIKPKERIGLIGANGTGKSTLLRLINGEYTPDEGDISKSKDCTLGFLNQDLLSYESHEPIINVAMQAFERENELSARINKILSKIETDYNDKLLDELAKLQTEFETLGGYSIQARAEEILEGLGFKTADLTKPLAQFSGGWRMRVMLAKLLLQKPALLMLDEPTNHLDLPSIEWLESYLNNYEGSIMIVSHDQDFLNNCCNVIVEVWGQDLVRYSGNYDFYREEKALRADIQQKAYENQQQKIRETERFIERFKAKATKAKQAQSRVKQLEKMERIEAVEEDTAGMRMRFTFKQPSGKVVAELDEVSKSYGDLKILEETEAMIERGDKIALIGANGKGKSTVLRLLADAESYNGGELKRGHNVRQSFYAQHQLEALHLDNDLLDELRSAGADRTEAELRAVLGCFLFAGDDIFKKIRVLSGGEKSRVALAKMLLSEANFLLLDEPTNHLDMKSVDILIEAVNNYEGTCIVVSHNRHFIQETANKIWWIEDGKIKEYPGTYDEFKYWKQKRDAEAKENAASQTEAQKVKETKQKEQKKNSNHLSQEEQKELQRKIRQAERNLENIEKEINKLEGDIKELEKELALPSTYEDPEKTEKLTKKHASLKKSLEARTSEWEDAMLEVEELK
ncbi:ribosomal protection-like ABC-F family protein [Bernardetia sp.]|uniref:ribosomal protection-like ABC-F family protein n=1 Tax=Bernardetia sp. TaxID=1937974 RepID=UPI0025BD96EE|nr:ABC-F family ATP-binding cassette domain-containing protein [Bernardetia sp.]